MKIDADKFINVIDPLYAYILGLIWADGHVFRKTTCVKFDNTFPDANYFQKIFLKSGKWNVYTRIPKEKTWKEKISIQVFNKKFHNFLVEMNYLTKNESADKILFSIPLSLRSYWILGLVDGDGHIRADGTYEIQIAGPIDQNWNYLETYCRLLNCKYRIRKVKTQRGQGSTFNITGLRNVHIFGEKIWGQTEFGLPRKRNQYEIIRKKCERLSSKHSGVSYDKKLKKFKAYTSMVNGQRGTHLGYFSSEEDAFNALQTKSASTVSSRGA